jgi:hypothetical protein
MRVLIQIPNLTNLTIGTTPVGVVHLKYNKMRYILARLGNGVATTG